MSYLTNTDISARVSLNPFQWQYMPWGTYDGPSLIFPSRRTVAFGWLFLQVFFDIDNGKMNVDAVSMPFAREEDDDL